MCLEVGGGERATLERETLKIAERVICLFFFFWSRVWKGGIQAEKEDLTLHRIRNTTPSQIGGKDRCTCWKIRD